MLDLANRVHLIKLAYFPEGVDYPNNGGRQLKSSRAGQQNNFIIFWPHFSIKKSPKKCNKTSCYILKVRQSREQIMFFSILPKNEQNSRSKEDAQDSEFRSFFWEN